MGEWGAKRDAKGKKGITRKDGEGKMSQKLEKMDEQRLGKNRNETVGES